MGWFNNDWTALSQDKEKSGRGIVNTVMILRVP
jgi:hypothetical protein